MILKKHGWNLSGLLSADFLILFAVSALFFILEIAVFSGLRFMTAYFRAQLVIAVGLLGLTGGGVAAAYFYVKPKQSVLYLGLLGALFAPLLGLGGILFSATAYWPALGLLITAFLPYGFLIGYYYKALDTSNVYAVELAGGAIGLGAALLLLPVLREENLLLSIFVVAAAMFFIFSVRRRGSFWGTAAAIFFVLVSVFALTANLRGDFLNLAKVAPCLWPTEKIFPKVTCQKDIFPGYRVLRSLGSVVDRIDIVDLGRGMLHSAYSGDATDGIKPYPALPYFRVDARLPYGVIERPRALIVGAAAEGVVKVVRAVGAEDITALDLNPAIIDLWQNDGAINEYARHPFGGVKLIAVDGRTFLDTSAEKFDIITMMNTHRSRDAGAFGEPDFLHTKEAFLGFWSHLTDEGFLSFEEKNLNPISEEAIRRIAATVISALRDLGVSNPQDHLVVYEWAGAFPETEMKAPSRQNAPFAYFAQFLLKKEPWTRGELDGLRGWAVEAAKTEGLVMPTNMVFHNWLWLPGGDSEYGSNYIGSIIAGHGAKSVSVLTDNRPFAIKFTEAAKGDFVYAAVIFSVIFAATLYLWMIKSGHGLVGSGGQKRGEYFKAGAFPIYFVIIGLGYMGLEVAMLLWLQRYLGSATLGIFITIGGLLFSSAISGYFFRGRIFKAVIYLAAVAALVAAALFLPSLLSGPLVFAQLSLRILLALVYVAVVGVCLGIFFPAGIRLAREYFPGGEAALFGLNGGAMAVAVPLSFLAASVGGLFLLAFISCFCMTAASYMLRARFLGN